MKLKANKKRDQTCILPLISYKYFIMFTEIIIQSTKYGNQYLFYTSKPKQTISGTRLFLIGILKMRGKGLKQTK